MIGRVTIFAAALLLSTATGVAAVPIDDLARQ